MSWFSRPLARGTAAACALACLALPGCGFKPLYGSSSATHDTTVMQQFASIQIPALRDRIGQQMRNLLIDALHPSGAATDYRYRLSVNTAEADLNLGLQENATSTRGQVRVTAQYWLIENKSGKTLLHETLRASTSYNILINQFSSVLSEDDARQKALEQISEDMTEHLALYFRTAEPTSG
jgi:LPS-assembly lipoprotein